MQQKDVAREVGTDVTSVRNWEANRSQPDLRFMPTVIRFLHCNPLPPAQTLGERLVRERTTLGLSQRDAAVRLGVDPGTLARWERGEQNPTGAALKRVESFLSGTPELLRPSEETATGEQQLHL
jgi:transcriptional regulator with XRE-family HTH domain